MPRRFGYTLLEVVAASALTGAVLVASLKLLREAVEMSERVDQRNLLHTLCVGKLEQHLNTTAATFTTSSESGTFAAEGFATMRYSVTGTDAPASGGITNRLMAVTCTVWTDTNGDTAISGGEPAVTLATKVAKMALYTAEAGG